MAKQSPGVREKENSSKTPVTNLDDVLLENARLTSEVQRLLKENEQRNAELAIISSVQQGLASKLDFQSIIDLVGDQVHAITNAKSIAIALYDKTSEMLSWPYWLTFGKRVEIPNRPMEKGITRRVMYAKKALNLGTEQEILANDAIPPQEGWTVGKSYLGVPFTVGHRILGALSLHDFDNEHAFHESDERLLQTLANSMSMALENARLFDETEQRAAELTIINSVQEGLASKLDIQAIYDLVGDKIREFFHNIDAEIRICDPKAKLIHIPYITDMGKRIVVDPLPLTDVGVSAYVLHTRRTLVINENMLEEMENYGSKLVPGGHQAKSAVFVPLVVNDQARGLLVLGDVEHEHAFSSSDVRLLETLANSMSTALENARLFDETQHLLKETEQRAAELAIINRVQEALASKLDMQAIYDLVGDKIRGIFDAQGIGIYIFNHETGIAYTPYCFLKRRLLIEPSPLSPVAQLMINTKQPTLYRTYSEYCAMGGKVLENEDQCKSGMYAPLMVGQHINGMVGVANVDKENAYGEADLRLLQTLANSLSVALENAWLFDETQSLLRETEQRNAELAIINSVQQGLASKLDIQSIYELVGEQLHRVFPKFDISVAAYDAEKDLVTTGYIIEHGRRIDLPPFHLENRGFISKMVQTGETIVVNENMVEESRKVGARTLEGTDRPKSHVLVPLMIHGVVRGLVVLQHMEQEHAFSDSDVRLLETIANSVSIALENARLFDQTQHLLKETEQRAAELAIINSVQQGLASKLDMQAIYDLVGDKIRDLLNAQSVWIITFDPATRTRRVRYSFENGQRYYSSHLIPYNKLTEHLIATKKPLVINQNFPEAIAKFEMINIAGTQEQVKSIAYIPIMAGEEVKGFISLPNVERENAFSDSDVNLLSTFASSMSIALENIRLFDETRRLLSETEQRAAELAIINSVQEGLVSKLDMQAIYDLVGDKIRDLFSAQSVWILTFDRVVRTRRVEYSFEDGQRYYTSELLPYNKLTEYLIATKKTLVINQDADTRIAEFEMSSVAGTARFKSAVFVPLMTDGEVKGFISLQNIEKENAFSESDISLLSTLASSMSVALENARLFDETQHLLNETEQRAAELSIINSVQQGLASKLDMQAIYELVGDKMQEIFDAQSLLIVMFDHANEMAQMTYNREMGVRYYAAPYPFTGLHRYIIQSRNTVVINENSLEWQAKFGMIQLPGTAAPKSMIFVPLTAGYRVSGLISLQNLEREHAFSDNDVRLLETLASSMSVALENASLFDDTQRLFLEAKEARTAAEQANQAKSAFLSSMSHELRTPLNAIINFVEMVARGMIGPVNQDQVELLDQALHSSKHLLNLINDVLDISKIQAGQLTLFIEDQVSVQVEVEATLNIVGGLIQEKGLQLIRDIDAQLPMISCDRRRLRQVLLNLISNAIKFTKAGTVTVSVKNRGQELLFAVIDTGPGIPPEKQDLIFEPFVQAENGQRQLQGTGLGLPISRSLIRAHGGELWVEGEGGEGSAFFFTLPVKRSNLP